MSGRRQEANTTFTAGSDSKTRQDDPKTPQKEGQADNLKTSWTMIADKAIAKFPDKFKKMTSDDIKVATQAWDDLVTSFDEIPHGIMVNMVYLIAMATETTNGASNWARHRDFIEGSLSCHPIA